MMDSGVYTAPLLRGARLPIPKNPFSPNSEYLWSVTLVKPKPERVGGLNELDLVSRTSLSPRYQYLMY